MNPLVGREEVTVTLTRFEWLVLLRGGRHLKNKSLRQIKKDPGFVPAPGCVDINREYLNQYNSALNKIEKAWGSPLNYYKS